jgi:small subunit ribosomal protein S1
MKQIEEDPWLGLPAKYPTGTSLGGTVRNLTSFGAFIEIENGIDGLVHVSDMSWTKRVQHPSEIVEKGAKIDVMVLDVDPENKRISLGLKQLTDDPWPTLVERFAPNAESSGVVVRIEDDGLTVDLGDDVEGFISLSDAGIEEGETLDEYYVPGDSVSIRVTHSDAADKKIELEITETPDKKAPEEIEEARAAAAALAAEKAEAESGPEDEPVGYRELKKKHKKETSSETEESSEEDEAAEPETEESSEEDEAAEPETEESSEEDEAAEPETEVAED